EVPWAAPHSIYFQFFSEWGMIAGILALAVVAWASYRWFIRTNDITKASPPNSDIVNTRVALTASFMAFLIHGLVSGITNTLVSQVIMVLVVAWMIGLSISTEKGKVRA